MTALYRLRVAYTPAQEDGVLAALDGVGAELLDGLDGDLVAIVGATSLARCRTALHDAGLPREAVDVSPAETADADTIARAAVRSTTVGGVHLVPWPADPGMTDGLVLESGPAFGTGLHPSTRLCLERMADWSPTAPLLDVGTGSGVLALTWLHRGGPRAVATDIDAVALEVARRNAIRNGLEDRLTLTDAEPDRLDQVFEWVVANMVAAHLTALAPRLVRALAPSARVLLCGVHRTQRDEVFAAYRHYGVHLVGEWNDGDWFCLELMPSW